MDNSATLHNQPIITVGEFSSAIKQAVETSFSYIRIKGEISGLKLAPSGHLYFSLKEENAVLAAVCWRGTVSQLQCKAEDGLEVICSGRITTYAGQSKYQLIVETIEASGTGALMALLEKRKKMLQAEGLFAPERKQLLPLFPTKIGVVTSPAGAVIQDILHRIKERFPCHVMIWPVLVQGQEAANQIAHAISGFNQLAEDKKPDVIIVARGGGSIEDLWAFNEEVVIRAAADSFIPLVSAIGHETDITLLDYVADVRAPTPTAAAEITVPVHSELLNQCNGLGQRLHIAINQLVQMKQQLINAYSKALPSPMQLLSNATQRLDHLAIQLKQTFNGYVHYKTHQVALLTGKLPSPQQYKERVDSLMQQLKTLEGRIRNALQNKLTNQKTSLAHLSRLLESYHYKKVLQRGFTLIRHKDKDQLITKSHNLKNKTPITIEFADGTKDALID